MSRVVSVGLAAGVALLITDALLNANPLARRLYAAYDPIARPSANALAGSAIDLVLGVILAVLFVTLWPSLPGETGLVKGLSFGVMVWFLRVVMRVASDWMTTTVPVSAHIYTLGGGLIQILLVAALIAVLLPRPVPAGAG
jgi:hypothetical protein